MDDILIMFLFNLLGVVIWTMAILAVYIVLYSMYHSGTLVWLLPLIPMVGWAGLITYHQLKDE